MISPGRVRAAARRIPKGCETIKIIKRRMHMLVMLMLAMIALMIAYFSYSV